MLKKLKRSVLSTMILMMPFALVRCKVDDDFFADGHLTDAIYATGDAISQIILVSGAVWGPYIH